MSYDVNLKAPTCSCQDSEDKPVAQMGVVSGVEAKGKRLSAEDMVPMVTIEGHARNLCSMSVATVNRIPLFYFL